MNESDYDSMGNFSRFGNPYRKIDRSNSNSPFLFRVAIVSVIAIMAVLIFTIY